MDGGMDGVDGLINMNIVSYHGWFGVQDGFLVALAFDQEVPVAGATALTAVFMGLSQFLPGGASLQVVCT